MYLCGELKLIRYLPVTGLVILWPEVCWGLDRGDELADSLSSKPVLFTYLPVLLSVHLYITLLSFIHNHPNTG